MKKRTRQNIPKLRSKKGMSLVELIVGIVIIVIVFTATLTAMTNGYTTTIYNADVNKNAVSGGSLNEIIMEAVSKQQFESKAGENGAEKYFFNNGNKTPNTDSSNAIHAAARMIYPDVQYVSPDDFPDSTIENQYTINLDAESDVEKKVGISAKAKIKGIEIKTSVTSVKGTVINSSFVPYGRQDNK